MSNPIVIIKNNTESPISINDLSGVTVDSTSQLTLTDIFYFCDIAKSVNLKTYVSNGNIIINDGSSDLSISNGLNHVSIKSSYNITREINQSVYFGHHLDDHLDVASPPIGTDRFLESQDGTSYNWINIKDKYKMYRSINFSFTSSERSNAIIIKTTSWQEIADFIFMGTDLLGIVTQVKIIAHMEYSNSSRGSFKIVNYNTGDIYCLLDEQIAGTAQTIYTMSDSLVFPETETLMGIQSKTSSSGKGVLVSSMHIRIEGILTN